MRLQYTHSDPGPGLVIVKSPDLGVRIILDLAATHRSVDILADQDLAAWAGPAGPKGKALGVETGKPSIGNSLKAWLGFRDGEFGSGEGSSAVSTDPSTHTVIRAARGGIAAGGNIVGCSIGKGVVVSNGDIIGDMPDPPVGVNLTIPWDCSIEIKSALSVTVFTEGREWTLEEAHRHGLLKKV